ncbi:unnamed protein product, partial [Brassica napus]
LIKIKSSKLRRLHQNQHSIVRIHIRFIHLVLHFHSSSMKPR